MQLQGKILLCLQEKKDFKEVVFCGLGEPTLRIETLKEAASAIKKGTYRTDSADIKIRLDTDGLANAVYGRNIAAELENIIDSVSISLNAQSSEIYDAICDPKLASKGIKPYNAVIDFVKESKKYIKNVTVTAIDLPAVDIAFIENLAKNLGVNFKLRHYNNVG